MKVVYCPLYMHCGLCARTRAHTHADAQINTNQPTKRSRRARSGASSLQSHNPSSGEAEAEERLLQVPGHPGLQNKTLSQIPNKLKAKPASPMRAKEEPVTRSWGWGWGMEGWDTTHIFTYFHGQSGTSQVRCGNEGSS